MREGLVVTRHSSPGEVEAAVWRALVPPEDVLRSQAWFAINASTEGCFRVVRQGARPVALCPAFANRRPGGYPFLDIYRILSGATLFGSARAPAVPAWEPHLVVAVPYGYCSPLLFCDGLEEDLRQRAAELLLQDLQAQAREEALSSVSFLYLPAEDPFLAWLSVRGISSGVVLADAVLPIAGRDWTAYLDDLGGPGRRRILAEWRSSERRGLAVVQVQPGRETPRILAEMERDLMEKHGHRAEAADWQGWYAELLERLGERVVLYYCLKEGQPVGFSLFIQGGGSLYAKATGYRYQQLSTGEFAYFMTAYYHPIRGAQARKVQRIHFGGGSYEAKLLRGCTLLPLSAAILPLGPRCRGLERSVVEYGRLVETYQAALSDRYGRPLLRRGQARASTNDEQQEP